jgi:hypothetical protein
MIDSTSISTPKSIDGMNISHNKMPLDGLPYTSLVEVLNFAFTTKSSTIWARAQQMKPPHMTIRYDFRRITLRQTKIIGIIIGIKACLMHYFVLVDFSTHPEKVKMLMRQSRENTSR